MLKGAEMPVEVSGKHRKGPEKTSPQGIHSKARSADVHEYCQNDGRPEMIDRRRCPEITDRS